MLSVSTIFTKKIEIVQNWDKNGPILNYLFAKVNNQMWDEKVIFIFFVDCLQKNFEIL